MGHLLKECSIPSAWKSSIICPVPKKESRTTLNLHRPVALTSLVMKCFDKIVLQHLLTLTSVWLAPVLCTLYTNDCRGTGITPVIKYSDDSAIEDLSTSDDVSFSAVREFYIWCKQNFLDPMPSTDNANQDCTAC